MDAPELSDAVELDIEVAYGLPGRQAVIPLQVPQGTTMLEAVLLSGIVEQFPGLDPASCKLGVFGELVEPGQPVSAGQRVEVYRPLLADPKEARRQRAAEGRTMGAQKDGG